jgi:hypothetical protein
LHSIDEILSRLLRPLRNSTETLSHNKLSESASSFIPSGADPVSSVIFQKMVEKKQIPFQLLQVLYYVSTDLKKVLIGEFEAKGFEENLLPTDLMRGSLNVELRLMLMDEAGKVDDGPIIPFQILTSIQDETSALLFGDWFNQLNSQLETRTPLIDQLQGSPANSLTTSAIETTCPQSLATLSSEKKPENIPPRSPSQRKLMQ